MHHTILNFPNLHLATRDAHKLRGYFANRFQEESDLFHNHEADGKSIYRYPLIQYKVISGHPMIVAIGEGAQWMVKAFLEVSEIQIEDQTYPLPSKNLKSRDVPIGVDNNLHRYEFCNPWMALSQKNFELFKKLNPEQQTEKLQKILTGNILSFFNATRHLEKERVMVNLNITERVITRFKNNPMEAFKGNFVTNVQLPDFIGLGRSASRGYGTIKQV